MGEHNANQPKYRHHEITSTQDLGSITAPKHSNGPFPPHLTHTRTAQMPTEVRSPPLAHPQNKLHSSSASATPLLLAALSRTEPSALVALSLLLLLPPSPPPPPLLLLPLLLPKEHYHPPALPTTAAAADAPGLSLDLLKFQLPLSRTEPPFLAVPPPPPPPPQLPLPPVTAARRRRPGALP